MKKPVPLLPMLLLSLAACQQPAPTNLGQPAAVPVARLAPAPATSGSQLTPQEQAFLVKYDVSQLLRANDSPLNGFFGTNQYRIELILTEVVADSSRPNTYLVRGKSRFKKAITPVSGTITLTQVVAQPDAPDADEQERRKPNNTFSALGTFQLREESLVRGAGRYAGQVALDFAVGRGAEIFSTGPHSAAQNSGIMFKGTWTNLATHEQKPVVLLYSIWSYAETVLKDFGLGERGVGLNPKYAKLGWDTFMENDEWWVEAATPAL